MRLVEKGVFPPGCNGGSLLYRPPWHGAPVAGRLLLLLPDGGPGLLLEVQRPSRSGGGGDAAGGGGLGGRRVSGGGGGAAAADGHPLATGLQLYRGTFYG